MVFRTLGRLTGESDVEDLAQEVFLRLFRALGGFRGEAKLTTFLYRIIVNVVNDEWKRRQRGRRATSLDDGGPGWGERLRDGAPDPAQILDARNLERHLREALLRLSPPERAAIVLYSQEQRSYEEIGAVLSVPVNTVKTHLHRARGKLKAELEERMGLCVKAT